MRKILPFNSDPRPKALQFHAFMAGMITAEESKAKEDWLLSYSLRVLNSDKYFCICYPGDCPKLLHELEGTAEDCFLRKRIFREELQGTHGENWPSDMIRRMVKQGYYAYGRFNEYYIPCKTCYHKEDFIHDYLVIGFDDAKACFYIAGYTAKEIFRVSEVRYGDFEQAVKMAGEENGSYLDFYKLNPEFPFGFRMSRAKRSLQEFVRSDEYSQYREKHCIYGERGLKLFSANMNRELAENSPFFYLRNMKSFCEHTEFFVRFLKYLMTNKYIKWESPYMDVIEYSPKSEMILNMAIKFYLTNKGEIAERIQTVIKEIVQKEIIAANALYQSKVLEIEAGSRGEEE